MRRVISALDKWPLHLIVVSGAKIDHDMLVPAQECLFSFWCGRGDGYTPIEEHNRAGIVQLIHLPIDAFQTSTIEKRRATITHLIEVRDLGDIAQVNHSKVLHLLRNTIESLVHSHALGIPVVTEPNDNDPVFFGFNCLVNMPARGKVREEVRHG